MVGARRGVDIICRSIGVGGSVFMALRIPEIAVTTFIIRDGELIRLVVANLKMQDKGAVTFLISKGIMIGLLYSVLAGGPVCALWDSHLADRQGRLRRWHSRDR